MKLFDKIRILRKARGLSQEQLGYSLSRVNKDGISRQTISDWENGNFEPKLENIRDLAEVLDVSFDVLLDDSIDLDDEKVLDRVLNKTQKKDIVVEPVANNKRSGNKLSYFILMVIATLLLLFSINLTYDYSAQLILFGPNMENLPVVIIILLIILADLAIAGVAFGLLINAIVKGKSVKNIVVLLLIALVLHLIYIGTSGAMSIKSYADRLKEYDSPVMRKTIAYQVSTLTFSVIKDLIYFALVIAAHKLNKNVKSIGPEVNK